MASRDASEGPALQVVPFSRIDPTMEDHQLLALQIGQAVGFAVVIGKLNQESLASIGLKELYDRSV